MQILGPVLRDFAVKRLFEIYRADQGKGHLAWVSDLGLRGIWGFENNSHRMRYVKS